MNKKLNSKSALFASCYFTRTKSKFARVLIYRGTSYEGQGSRIRGDARCWRIQRFQRSVRAYPRYTRSSTYRRSIAIRSNAIHVASSGRCLMNDLAIIFSSSVAAALPLSQRAVSSLLKTREARLPDFRPVNYLYNWFSLRFCSLLCRLINFHSDTV